MFVSYSVSRAVNPMIHNYFVKWKYFPKNSARIQQASTSHFSTFKPDMHLLFSIFWLCSDVNGCARCCFTSKTNWIKEQLVKRWYLICSHVITGGCWYTACSYTPSNNSLAVVVAKCWRDFQWLYHSFTVPLSTDCGLFKFGLLFLSSWLLLMRVLAAVSSAQVEQGAEADHPAGWRQGAWEQSPLLASNYVLGDLPAAPHKASPFPCFLQTLAIAES